MISATLEASQRQADTTWLKRLSRYRQPDRLRSVFELGVTIIPFVALWALAATAVVNGVWWGLLLTIPAAGFLVRLFMIQHDCGHGAFFGQRQVDDWIGRAIGVLTLTPYDSWRRSHAIHHASSGNLDARGIGDVKTLTVAEYNALSPMGQLGYRLYRHPAVMFGLGPIWLFILHPAAARPAERGPCAVGLDHGDQCGDRRALCRADRADRLAAVPFDPAAHRA